MTKISEEEYLFMCKTLSGECDSKAGCRECYLHQYNEELFKKFFPAPKSCVGLVIRELLKEHVEKGEQAAADA